MIRNYSDPSFHVVLRQFFLFRTYHVLKLIKICNQDKGKSQSFQDLRAHPLNFKILSGYVLKYRLQT